MAPPRCSVLLLATGLALVASSSAAVPCSYIIDTDDTLSDVANQFDLTVEQLAEANPQLEDLDLIRVGNVITLPCPNENVTSGESVLDLLAQRPDMGILFRAIVATGLQDTLADPSLVATVFAPSDAAFGRLLDRLGNTTVDDLLADRAMLNELLGYHVVPGQALEEEQLNPGRNLTTLLEGESLQVFQPGDIKRLTTGAGQRARILDTDLQAGEAVVHLVRGVLLPSSYRDELPPAPSGCSYTVQEGDFLFQIAEDFDTTVEALVELNPELEENPALLPIGTQLIVSPECEV